MRGAVPLIALLTLGAASCNLLVGIEPWDATAASTTASSSSVGGATSAAESSTSRAASSSGEGGAPVTPRCDDREKNGDESDVDCGGDACPPCDLDQQCATAADCVTLTCAANLCVAFMKPECPQNPDPTQPTCADCIQDGDETDVDCGGVCLPCAETLSCLLDGDCISSSCVALVCGPPVVVGCSVEDPRNPTCADCVTNGAETDVDCGGDSCAPCADHLVCLGDADCATAPCLGGHCGGPAPP